MCLETLQHAVTGRPVRVLLMEAAEYGRSFLARAETGANPILFYPMASPRLRQDVPAGTVIRAEMVAPPPASVRWRLRRVMEAWFGLV